MPEARALARRLIETLAADGSIAIEEEKWRAIRAFPRREVATMAEELVRTEPSYRTDVGLMLRCGGALAAILRGEEGARSVLFSPDAIEELTRFYREAPASAFYNKIVTAVAKAVLAHNDGPGPVRILEVGGGTGGCTAPLLEAVAERAIEYTFTDVSPFFVGMAAREFANRPGFKALALDLERDPIAQGFGPNGADVVVAANVLHATADLATSLARIQQLLAPGGLLILLEITRRPAWLDVIFGVTDGWWKFSDRDLRPAHALLESAQWKSLLARQGFEDVTEVTDTNHTGVAGQTVFVAHAPQVRTAPAAGAANAKWLILSDQGQGGSRLAGALAENGHNSAMVTPGEAFVRVGPNHFEARRGHEEDLRRVIEAIDPDRTAFRGIIFLGSMDFPADEEISVDALVNAQRTACGGPLAILKIIDGFPKEKAPQLIFVTSGAQSVADGERLALAQSPVWGLARVVMREIPAGRVRLIDVEAAPSDDVMEALAREIVTPSTEEEIALRAGKRWVRRLERVGASSEPVEDNERAAEPGDAWQVEIETPGALATLRTRRTSRVAPVSGEVEIAIAAAALNFRDVMLAAGMIPSVATEPSFGKQGLGLDCAGRIARVGAGTGTFEVGDEVLAIAPTALASFTNTRMELVARKPAHLSFEQAAAIPCAFVTAHYALERLARLARGERILIHAATGGVGLAALQIANAIGAEVFATAGSPEKRAYLKSLGVKWIMDSRSLAFADEILEITNGAGIDVVLNSLAGEAIPRGIALLSPYGRFVEIGKRDIYGDSKIGLLAFRKNLSFFAVDLDRLCNERPALAGEMLREVVARFESGGLQPLPQEVFPASEAEAAVRQMAQARHMGKIVLRTDDPDLRIVTTKAVIRDDGTYLIAGGLGGFGLATARWLVREGARSLVLMGRSAAGESAEQTIAALRSAGAQVVVARGDVTAARDVRRIVEEIRATLPPLRGVFHAAMVLDDAPLLEMTWPRFEAALPAKIAGAWNLHRETLADELDYFVLYSSIATIFGNPMQSNYSAANAFLDALAHHRQALGLPALAVNWGVLEDVGYVSQHREIGQYLTARGYEGFTSDQALGGAWPAPGAPRRPGGRGPN